MGPKPKKPKKTKAELEEERLAKEEEERKAKIAEEKRIAEENEKRRQEAIRLAAEQKSFREKELARWNVEYAQIADEIKGREVQLIAEEKNEAKILDWIKYKNPDGVHDAWNEKDMNSFITQMRETSVQDMKDAMEIIRKIESIARASEETWIDSYANHNQKLQDLSIQNLIIFREMILEKIDQATIPLIRFSDKILDDEKELFIEEIATRAGVGMWASFHEDRLARKSVNLEQIGVKFDVPKQLLNHNERFLYRIIRLPIVPYNFEAYGNYSKNTEIHLQTPTRYVVGDLIHFDILFPTPTPFVIRAKKWTLRDKSGDSMNIRTSSYPSSASTRIYIKLPDHVVLSEGLRIAVWDATKHDWVEDDINDFQLSKTTHIAQFLTTTVGVFALVKKRGFDMPLKAWTIYPVLDKKINAFMNYSGNVSDNTVGFVSSEDIIANFRGLITSFAPASSTSNSTTPPTYERHARLKIQLIDGSPDIIIDIIGSQVCLIKPDSVPFQDILHKRLSPGVLLKLLQNKGINLLPAECDLQSVVNCCPKRKILEVEVLKQIALAASALEFASNPWNSTLNKSQIGVTLRESTVYTCPVESNEFECVLVERDENSISYQNTPELGFAPGPDGIQYTLVLGNEYGNKNEFSLVPRPNEEPHLELSRTLEKRITKESLERIQRVNQRFSKTVFTLLSLIKPLSLS